MTASETTAKKGPAACGCPPLSGPAAGHLDLRFSFYLDGDLFVQTAVGHPRSRPRIHIPTDTGKLCQRLYQVRHSQEPAELVICRIGDRSGFAGARNTSG